MLHTHHVGPQVKKVIACKKLLRYTVGSMFQTPVHTIQLGSHCYKDVQYFCCITMVLLMWGLLHQEPHLSIIDGTSFWPLTAIVKVNSSTAPISTHLGNCFLSISVKKIKKNVIFQSSTCETKSKNLPLCSHHSRLSKPPRRYLTLIFFGLNWFSPRFYVPTHLKLCLLLQEDTAHQSLQ